MAYDPSLRRKCLASSERRVTSSSRIGALLYPPFSRALLPLPAFPLLKSPLPSDFRQTDRYAHRPQRHRKQYRQPLLEQLFHSAHLLSPPLPSRSLTKNRRPYTEQGWRFFIDWERWRRLNKQIERLYEFEMAYRV